MSRHKRLPQLTAVEKRRFKARLRKHGKCLVCTGANINGYATVKIRGRYYFAHRIAYYLATGRDPGSKLVCHTCDNPPCCLPRHLFAGTSKDNMQDKVCKGRARSNPPRGTEHCNAKLTATEVRRIRQSTESNRALATKYGIDHRGVGRIKRHEAYANVA